MRKILYVVAEAVPFIKTGGLADVAGSLPAELVKGGNDVRIVLPEYKAIKEKYGTRMTHLYHGEIELAWRHKYFGVEMLRQDDVIYYFVDNDDYFCRDNLYGYGDDDERFAYFSRAVLALLSVTDFWPEIIHANDWHSALVPMFLRILYNNDERYGRIKTVLTIHNLKYQGIFGQNIVEDVLGIDRYFFDNGDLEFYGAVNFMKGGIVYADCITTVSRTYAQEIQQRSFGEGLDGLLRERKDDLLGIVNGIDCELYNPATDKKILHNFTADNFVAKRENKVALQRQLGLPVGKEIPMVSLISRLVEQKGIDLLACIIDEILEQEDIQLVVIGTGDREYEDWFKALENRFPTKVSANILFTDELAQKLYAASTMLLMPSQYEPCGLSQIIAMRYGTVPIVRATGGLADTVQNYDKATGKGTGFTFADYNEIDLKAVIKEALNCYHCDNGRVWGNIVRNVMKADFSWGKSAQEYVKLYNKLLRKQNL